ncbi:MAG: hypothetical protein M5U28_55220 [Sandaracinaceae bacterium]|nr:hypothetical protein [Sandaracinaceae bacterium]
MRVAAIASVLLLGGCLPDLSAWQVVAGRADGGNLPREDGGTGQPNPLDLGPPCPSPHLLLGTIGSSSDAARVLRLDPATGAMCRTSELLEVQRAYGSAISDVEWHAEAGTVLGLSDAVLGLDGEGFPRWRHEPFEYASFRGEWLAAFGSGSSLRVAVAWSERSSSLDSMLLLDAQGHRTSGDITPPFFGAMIAAHPDGSGRLLIPLARGRGPRRLRGGRREHERARLHGGAALDGRRGPARHLRQPHAPRDRPREGPPRHHARARHRLLDGRHGAAGERHRLPELLRDLPRLGAGSERRRLLHLQREAGPARATSCACDRAGASS